MAKNQKAAKSGPVVYCGPSIPGVAKQYTVFTGGLPDALKRAVEQRPVLAELVLPLEQLPEAMKSLRAESGHIYELYRIVQKNH